MARVGPAGLVARLDCSYQAAAARPRGASVRRLLRHRGVLLWLLTLAVGGPGRGASGLLISISALALAWIVGFVTPGSSAGFGVREAVLIVVLQSSLDRETAVLVALALRLVTLAGDLLLFVASLALPLPDSRSRQDSIEIKKQYPAKLTLG
jgi:hypothetical protein